MSERLVLSDKYVNVRGDLNELYYICCVRFVLVILSVPLPSTLNAYLFLVPLTCPFCHDVDDDSADEGGGCCEV